MDSLPKRPNTPPSPPRRGSRHVSPPTVQRPGPSSWEPPRPRSPGVWDRDRGRPMYRPRSRSRSRSYDYNYDYRRRSPPPPHHSRLPRRAWERSRSRSPPPPPKSSVPCKYFSRPTGCDKGSRCRFRHDEPRGRSFSRSRSRSRSPRSRSPPLRYRRGESPMLVPRGGMRSPQPSLLQRLGPVAPMKPISPMRSRAVSNDPNEPLEEGEERSPGRRGGVARGKGRKRNDQVRDKGNWDSFVADEDEDMSEGGRGSRKTYESRRGRSRSRSPRQRTRSPSRSRSRSPRNTDTVPTRSNSQEKRSHHSAPYPPRRSHSRSRSRSARLRSSTRSRDQTPSQGRSRTRSRSHSPSGRSRSRSRSPRPERDREPAVERDREPAVERDSKNPAQAVNPGLSSATAGPAIPTGPRLRTGANSQAPGAPAPRVAPAAGRGGPPPTGPRGDREPPRGPRNMVASSIAAGVAGGAGLGPAPSWERPQSAFQTYLAAVQSKLDQREGKKKDDGPAPDSEAEAKTTDVPVESDAMDVDVAEVRSQSHTPLPGPSVEGSRVASPAYPSLNARQASASLHASPAVGQNTPLPSVSTPSALGSSLPLPHTLPPRPRSPPRGPRATRAPADRPKGPGLESGVGDAERARDRNDWVGGEVNRKVHAPPANPQRPRRATKREALFPDLEKELANLEEQRARLANDHLPLEIALRQAADELALTTIDCRAAEDRRVMTETVLEAMVKGGGLAAGGDI